jgi:PAS domain S-box-containing protein
MNFDVGTPGSAGAEAGDFGHHYWRTTPELSRPLPELTSASIDDAAFRLLADNIPTLCWMASGDGYIVWYNRRWHEYCGTTPEQMEGWGWQSVHDPELLPQVMERWTASIATGEPFEMTFPLRGADGAYRPFLTRIQPVRDATGKVARWFGVNTDVSGQAAAEAAVRAEQERTRRALDSISEGFVLLDREFRVVQINVEGLRLEKRPASHIVGRTHWEVWPGTEHSELGRNYRKAMREGVPVALEHRYQWAAGHDAWLDMRAYPTEDGLAIFYRDITDRKRAEEALRASESEAKRVAALLEAVGASSPSLIYAKDKDCRIVYANPATLGVFGRTANEVIGRTAAELAGISDEGEVHIDNDRHVMESGVVEVMDEVFTTPDGVIRTFRSTKAPLRSADGDIIGIAGVSIDVTDRLAAEQALRESEARFRVLTNAVPSFVWFATPDGAIHFLNDRWHEYTGQAPEEALSDGWARAVHPDDADQTASTWAASVTGGDSYEIELRYRRKEGAYRWYIARAEPVRDPSGAITAWIGTSTDIHDRKVAEDALLESEARLSAQFAELEAVYSGAPLGLGLLDCDLRFVRINPALAEMNGFSVEQHLGRSVWELLPDLREVAEPAVRRVIESGEPLRDVPITGSTPAQPGVVRHWNEQFYPLKDRNGQVLGIGIICEEVTEQKQAEERLRESEARQRAITEATPECIKIVARDGRLLHMNAAGLRMIEAPDAESVQEADTLSLIAPEHQRRWRESHSRVLAGESLSWEFDIIGLAGTRRQMETHAVPLILPDGTVAQLAVTRDVTDRKRAEERLRESETRLRLAVDAAHMAIWEFELRTNTLRGSPQLNRLLGLSADEPLNIGKIRARFFPGERERLEKVGQEALRHPDRFGEIEFRYGLPSGEVRWLLLRAQAQIDASDAPSSYVGVMMDITERKKAEEHQRLLIDELNHRVKNTLAIVQGIAQQSFKGPSFPPETRRAFEGRLAALSAAHNLLTRQNWEAASIRRIIGDTVAAVGPRFDGVQIEGPDLFLAPKTAVSLAMAVHELATNAVKYGSLSEPEGQAEVRWQIEDDRLKLVWRERGGPHVEPPTKRGFGTRMIERGLAGELGGEVKIEFKATGLVCTVDAPLPGAGS